MPTIPALDLTGVSINLDLLARIPYALTLYHQALPLAADDDAITVVMAHPENHRTVAAIARLLQHPVVPIRGDPAAILALLHNTHPGACSSGTDILAWSTSASTEAGVETVAEHVGALMNAAVVSVHTTGVLDEQMAALSVGERFRLVVTGFPYPGALRALLQTATPPLLFVRGDDCPLRRILLVMRGGSSDCVLVDQVAPFVRNADTTSVLPLLPPAAGMMSAFLRHHGDIRRHVDDCLAHLKLSTTVRLILRQGSPAEQVAAELAAADYDLLVIAVEDTGEFVGAVLESYAQQISSCNCSVLVVKPAIACTSSAPLM
ncbi:MAG: universal stress protein [Caldilineaceae bacterium]|nr:universal stress protein [Caldilineaceae bacterium]